MGVAGNLMFVVGATQARELKNIRKIIPDNFLLIPGIGAQDGNVEEVSKYGINKDCGLIVNVGRYVIYTADDKTFAEAAAKAAREYHEEMKNYLIAYGQ